MGPGREAGTAACIKDYDNKEYAEMLAEKISQKHIPFDKDSFISEIVSNAEGKEYSQRIISIVCVFDRHLPEHPENN